MIRPGRFDPPSRQKVVYGEPLAAALPDILSEFWVNRAVLVTSASLSGPRGVAEQVRALLGAKLFADIPDIRRNAPREDVVRVAASLRNTGVEAVIALGGGSVMEAVKAARICLTNNVRTAPDLDRLKGVTTAASPRPYLFAIPTTLSGAECTSTAGVLDERSGRKDAFHHQDLAPDAVLLDPALTRPTPDDLWFGSGMRAFDHAVETWCSARPAPVADATALYAACTLAESLPRSRRRPDDLGARLACQVGAWMAIQGAAMGVPHGLSHALGRALGEIGGLAPGIASAIVLPHVLRFTAAETGDRQARLAASLGAAGRPLADLTVALAADLGLPSRLEETGLAQDLLPAIASAAVSDPRLDNDQRSAGGEAGLSELLRAAW